MVATLLREAVSFERDKYPHSYLTERLRMDVLESEHLLQARLSNMIAYASLSAHEKSDLQKGAQQVGAMYGRALEAVPYIVTGNSDSGQDLQRDREDAVQRWRKMEERRKQKDGAT